MSTVNITKADEEVLCELHRNLEMSAESTTAVIKKVENKELLTLLTDVVMKSTGLLEKVKVTMHERGIEPKDITKLKQISVDMGIMVNTMFDSTDSHIAEMMVKGLEMGVVSLRNLLKAMPPKDSAVSELCAEIVNLESSYAHSIGKFVEQ